ncbi:SPOR domain-containing protein [Bacillus sp. B-jedd]|uniref:SPOR domain-containing protein n=1 Tax=Bacillus sp. B-jedd TaxID=1476857 RepID=UPI0005156C2B|nr:SPOR domain-containing protein [Bacillus sp. B-jedd]CEG29098.1 phage-like protein [Bacillus sp. B-jedd]
MGKKIFVQIIAIILILAVMPGAAKRYQANTSINVLGRGYKDINIEISPGEDPAVKIQQGLNEAKTSRTPIKVIVPEGNFILNKSLFIYKDTYLKTSPNTVFTRNHMGSMMLNGTRVDSFTGYGGNSNFIIDGGIWVANSENTACSANIFSFAHAENVVIQNGTFLNVINSHAADLAGVGSVLIQNNKFLGFKDNSTTRSYSEAVQVDVIRSADSFSSFGSWDSTQTRNVTVTNNYFGASSTPGFTAWGRGIGSHTAVYGRQYDNITVTNNVFDGMSREAIYGFAWSNVKIQGNQFQNIASNAVEIYVPYVGYHTVNAFGQQMNVSEGIKNIVIEKNKFTNIGLKAIKLSGRTGAPINGVKVLNNQFLNISSTNLLDKNSYVINLQSIYGYHRIENAYKTFDEANNAGTKVAANLKYPTQTEPLGKQNLYRLRTGTFNSSAVAKSALTRFKKSTGINGTVYKTGAKYYILSSNIAGETKLNQLYTKLKSQTGWVVYKDTVYNLRTGTFNSYTTAQGSLTKFQSITGAKGTIKPIVISGTMKYYILSNEITGRATIDSVYNKLKVKTGWVLYKDLGYTASSYKVNMGKFLTKSEADAGVAKVKGIGVPVQKIIYYP